MKKKIISFSTALMMVFGLAENATAEELVVVNDAQGGKSVFKLSTRPTISFDNYNIVLTTDETTVMYPLTEYLSFSLIDDNSSAKQNVANDPSFSFHNGLDAKGLVPGSQVMIYGISGVLIAQGTANEEGNVTIAINKANNQVFLVKTSNGCFKFISPKR